MRNRSIAGVLGELQEESHIPMVGFVEELRRRPWATTLKYDLSMLRLWISREDAHDVEVMIIYDDGRKGGKPLEPYVDAFEMALFAGRDVSEVFTGTSFETIERLRAWLQQKSREVPNEWT
ncbi:MAG: hypothetical protein ACM34E_19210 [Acidobacteriota bacterium]